LNADVARICGELGIDDSRYIEIEAKRKVAPDELPALRDHFRTLKSVRALHTARFFDQYLDTPGLELLKAGASLRLRYKDGGANVYLQYKGPGFHEDGVLYRSEFSSPRLAHVVREESHHDIVHFSDTTIEEILDSHVEKPMADAMRRHLGDAVVSRISRGPILALYEKEKYEVDLGAAALEPSLDRIFAFHINAVGLHTLSTFAEYENEVKGPDLEAKLQGLEKLHAFDEKLAQRFDLPSEPLSKYHRCASCFLPSPAVQP
jgi:hypothetical protein